MHFICELREDVWNHHLFSRLLWELIDFEIFIKNYLFFPHCSGGTHIFKNSSCRTGLRTTVRSFFLRRICLIPDLAENCGFCSVKYILCRSFSGVFWKHDFRNRRKCGSVGSSEISIWLLLWKKCIELLRFLW